MKVLQQLTKKNRLNTKQYKLVIICGEGNSAAQKIAWEACPWLFLGNDQIIYSTKSYLSGVYVSPDGAFNFANATLAQ